MQVVFAVPFHLGRRGYQRLGVRGFYSVSHITLRQTSVFFPPILHVPSYQCWTCVSIVGWFCCLFLSLCEVACLELDQPILQLFKKKILAVLVSEIGLHDTAPFFSLSAAPSLLLTPSFVRPSQGSPFLSLFACLSKRVSPVTVPSGSALPLFPLTPAGVARLHRGRVGK